MSEYIKYDDSGKPPVAALLGAVSVPMGWMPPMLPPLGAALIWQVRQSQQAPSKALLMPLLC